MKKHLFIFLSVLILSVSSLFAQSFDLSGVDLDELAHSADAECSTWQQFVTKYASQYDSASDFLSATGLEGVGLDSSTIDSINTMTGTVDTLLGAASSKLFNAVPNATSMINIYPDAYIGQLIGLPPHFAFGSSTSFALMDVSDFTSALSAMGVDRLASLDYLPLPTMAADVRIGGIILPFDFGVAVNVLNSSMLSPVAGMLGYGEYADAINLDFLTVNADFRYCLIKEGTLRPCVSVGGGYTYHKAGISYASDSVSAGLECQTHLIYADAQISKKVLFITPFAGLKLITDYTKVNYDWALGGEQAENIALYNSTMASLDGGSAYIINTSNSSEISNHFFSRIMPQVYGGFGINILALRLNSSIGFDFTTKTCSGALSMRIQI